MNTNAKLKWLGALLGVCIIAIATESYYLWDLDKQIKHADDQNYAALWSKDNSPVADSWDPASQFIKMQQQMNQLMNQMSASNALLSQQTFGLPLSSPEITMKEDSDAYEVFVNVPKGEDVEINTDLNDNQLTVSGKVKQDEKHQSHGLLERSVVIGEFSQTMNFSNPIDESGVKTTRDHDRYVITVPKVS